MDDDTEICTVLNTTLTLDGESDSDIGVSTSFAISPIITILVGRKKCKYTAHKILLQLRSPFFARCLAVGMKEALTSMVELPEDHVQAFDLFITWIYHGKVRSIEKEKDDDTKHGSKQLLPLVQAWVLADKFDMEVWQNKVIDALAKWWNEVPVYPATINWVVSNVDEASMLFKMVMDQFAWDLSDARYRVLVGGTRAAEGMKELLATGRFPEQVLWYAIETDQDEVDRPVKFPCKYHLHHRSVKCQPPQKK
ncbi:hypothetical protein A1O1_03034 [Capronia coronata CBS 617.96]|uniref:BTB domain-containing protein n=1 Tax=Capronia coronata CBS 617.96 TaxID=1182541 RepID=W9YQ01_9EURO|nr:uncharacterized protein A1O1_03034 [Capronia coronata CBS 617.96]EXJ94638.1 hypothetical protein A1O1_03034 [Capronia coronata CBS 617.96]